MYIKRQEYDQQPAEQAGVVQLVPQCLADGNTQKYRNNQYDRVWGPEYLHVTRSGYAK